MFGAGLLRGRQLLDWSDNALEVRAQPSFATGWSHSWQRQSSTIGDPRPECEDLLAWRRHRAATGSDNTADTKACPAIHGMVLQVNVWYIVLSVALVLFAGCMSGLTLGLLQLDIVDLEVLRRSGTAQERRYAQVLHSCVTRPCLCIWLACDD